MSFFLDLEDEGITFLRNVGNQSPSGTASCCTRPESSKWVLLPSCYFI